MTAFVMNWLQSAIVKGHGESGRGWNILVRRRCNRPARQTARGSETFVSSMQLASIFEAHGAREMARDGELVTQLRWSPGRSIKDAKVLIS